MSEHKNSEEILEKARKAILELPEEYQPELLKLYDETVKRHLELQQNKADTDRALERLAVNRALLKEKWAQFEDALGDLRFRVKVLLHDIESRNRENQ